MSDRLFCKGYTWGFLSQAGDMQTDDAEKSMRRLASNGLDWICITVNGWQEYFYSSTVFSHYQYTQTDKDVETAVKMAKSLGLKVCLKPMVNCLDGSWRARIDFPDDEKCSYYWEKWFESYNAFMRHYAEMAEDLGVEMLCTGCEMKGMDKQSDYCRKMIKNVRNIYKGILMHNVNRGDETCSEWLDEVDVVGISAYYPVTDEQNKGIDTMRLRWKESVKILDECHSKYGKPVMFAEIGVRNERGCTMYPWDFKDRPDFPIDEDEQSDFYESAMEATWNIPWFAGYFWWDWKVIIPDENAMKNDRDFTVYGKKAEKTLRKWYLNN
ncbi:MAG: hypothetical protein K6E28_01560 [Eubacterium sp.]|nr:hypothetical protein [Eubacterium sp.]